MATPKPYNVENPPPSQNQIDRKTGAAVAPDLISPEQAMEMQNLIDAGLAPGVEEKPPAEGEEVKPAAEGVEEKPPAEGEEVKPVIADPNEVITVGGISKTRAEWLDEYSQKRNLDVSSLDEQTRNELLDDYIANQHKDTWQKTTTIRAQDLADESRAVQAQLQSSRDAERSARQLLDRVTAEEAKLQPVAEEEVSAEEAQGDVIKVRHFNKVMDARERLQEIGQEKKQIADQVSQNALERTYLEMSLLQTTNPQYKTEQSIRLLIEDMDRRKDYTNPDVDKVRDLVDIVRHSQEYGMTPQEAKKDLEKTGRLRVKAEKPPLPKPKPQQSERDKVVNAITKNQGGAQHLSSRGGQQVAKARAVPPPLGDALREASDKARGVAKNDALDKADY